MSYCPGCRSELHLPADHPRIWLLLGELMDISFILQTISWFDFVELKENHSKRWSEMHCVCVCVCYDWSKNDWLRAWKSEKLDKNCFHRRCTCSLSTFCPVSKFRMLSYTIYRASPTPTTCAHATSASIQTTHASITAEQVREAGHILRPLWKIISCLIEFLSYSSTGKKTLNFSFTHTC